MQRFHCRSCQTKLSPMYPLAEIDQRYAIYVCRMLFARYSSFDLAIHCFLFSLMDIFYLAIDTRILYFSWAFLWAYWVLTEQFHLETSLAFGLISYGLLRYGQSLFEAQVIRYSYLVGRRTPLFTATHALFYRQLSWFKVIFVSLLYSIRKKHLPFVPFLSIALWLVLYFSDSTKRRSI